MESVMRVRGRCEAVKSGRRSRWAGNLQLALAGGPSPFGLPGGFELRVPLDRHGHFETVAPAAIHVGDVTSHALNFETGLTIRGHRPSVEIVDAQLHLLHTHIS